MEDQTTTTGASEGTEMTLQAKLADIDGFPVEWAGRNKDGHYELTASKFRVTVPVPELLGQNIAEFNFADAMALADESGDPEFHDFGICTIKRPSLRRLPNGEWAMDLRVPRHHRRKCDAAFDQEVLDEEGEPVLDENGDPTTEMIVKTKTESWITVLLTQVEPVTDHPLSKRYVQTDSETAADLRLNAQSDKIAEGKKASGPRKPKAKSKRVSPAQVRAMLAAKQQQG